MDWQEKLRLVAEINQVFRPGAPVEEHVRVRNGHGLVIKFPLKFCGLDRIHRRRVEDLRAPVRTARRLFREDDGPHERRAALQLLPQARHAPPGGRRLKD